MSAGIPNLRLDLDRIAAADWLAVRDALKDLRQAVIDQAIGLMTLNAGWVTVAFDVTDYTAETGVVADANWTVQAADVLHFRYLRIQDTLTVQFVIDASSTGVIATDTALLIRIPGGFRAAPGSRQTGYLVWGEAPGAEEAGAVFVDGVGVEPSDQLILVKLPLGTVWGAGVVNALSVRGYITFEIAKRGR